MFRILVTLIALAYFVIQSPKVNAFANPNNDHRVEAMEDALLQQLHPLITKSLQDIYKEKYSQYKCEKILTINERFTISKKKESVMTVDALHGGRYFDILVGICRPDGQRLQLLFKNDTPNSKYYLVTYNFL